MNSSKIFLILFFSLVCILQQQCTTSSDKVSDATAAQNDLPTMTLTTLDDTELNVKDLKGKIVLVLFQTDCDHCQREAAAIQQNISAFKAYSLYFITTTSKQDIETFANQYKLNGHPNLHFCRTTSQNILNSFGPIDAPSLYIFSDQKLVKAFNGETDINEILKYI